MKKSAVILIILFSSLLFASSGSGDDNKNTKDSEFVEQLVSMVTSILQGEDYTKFKENISPEAYVINNNIYESIFEILENPAKKENFIERKEMSDGLIHMWMPNNQDNAYMVLERKTSDNTKTSWHSILFKMDKNRKWQILSWHKS